MAMAPLYNTLRKRDVDNTELLRMILLYRFFFYETDEPFFQQFERNNCRLILELKRMITELNE